MRGCLWNARGVKNKRWELKKYINDFDIICITETKLKPNDRLISSGYNTYRKDGRQNGNSVSGGVAVLVRKQFHQSPVKINVILDNTDCVGVQLRTSHG